ncbi:two-component system CheB/CheR fusion protein [Pedobacter sp. CAN_A7]|uniref:CheR family methyltransferase n=1 Tax=Pedobacter sp. CAN_A7 TaxID=2787722 RepID=UPI0018CBC7AD
MVSSSKTQGQIFPIIGMGGSAGSFHAFETFFLHLPVPSGFAYVIIMHLDPSQHMDVAGLLQTATPMPIVEAEDGMEVQPDHVYVIPSGKDMGIHKGQLLLMQATRKRGAHMAIDYFLQSLAEDRNNMAVAIIFSGMGSDGETGVRMIKEKLGMTMTQDPESAEYSSMPLAAIKTNMVDYVLLPQNMPLKLIQYLTHPAINSLNGGSFDSERNQATQFQKILMMLRSHTGHDFSLYKKNTITRRLERRIAFHQLPDYTSYVNYLRENPDEVSLLFNELLIGVTKFFRDYQAFDTLKTYLQQLFKIKAQADPIRVWVAGCSTGEEAYSIAIYVLEYLDSLQIKQKPRVQIFATDLDANAIEHARAGYYFGNIVSEVSTARLERFFIKKDEGYVVKKEVREVVVFAQHNLIKDAPFTKLDLICCRNVMIYLTIELQKKIIPIFHYSLLNRGLLFLGPAESLGVYSDAFVTLDAKWKIYEKKEGSSVANKIADFPFDISNQTKNIKLELQQKQKSPISETFNKLILAKYTPASLLLTDKGEILYISGQVGKYLQINSGEAVMNIHRMIREELKHVLGNAIYQAHERRQNISVNKVKFNLDSKIELVTITVDYLTDIHLQGLLLVTFQDLGPYKKLRNTSKSTEYANGGALDELEKELIYTKQQLHTTIEQMETSLAELKSTNEELQSTNEELQSTNEEALTTKEEMQSLNEELMTINLQYQIKAEESTQLNNDMKNLLDSTEIGTIFLDHQLNILRFTPQVSKLFNLIPTDVGRSIMHIVTNFDYPDLDKKIAEVIEKLNGRQIQVKTKEKEWYNLRIMPYRTIDNFIGGAVLTFTKITSNKKMELQLSTLKSFAQQIIDQRSEGVLILDQESKIMVVNQLFLQTFQMQEVQLIEQFFTDICHKKWRTNKFDKLLLNNKPQAFETLIQQETAGKGLALFTVRIEPFYAIEEQSFQAMMVTFKAQHREGLE